ncbi:hypothetical protein [uncultured Marinobacter sp.]|uniref:hypothetical protein n=1 Tax=uncultured Marinobacter sp. TaxID=187379 RepID=UPI002595BB97|nr:hypothetical protein [uncultured Marinobacter sp.]
MKTAKTMDETQEVEITDLENVDVEDADVEDADMEYADFETIETIAMTRTITFIIQKTKLVQLYVS